MESQQSPDRNLAMELMRATEAAALAGGRWMGRGDKNAADGASVDAMRLALNSISMDGPVVIGEGEKDEAPMLFNGEHIGDGSPPLMDIAGAVSVVWSVSGIDVLVGIGGTPEGVLAAAGIKCLGGAIQGRLWPRNDDERRAALDMGYDLDKVLTTDDLVAGDDEFFAATGVTDGDLLRGVRYWGDGASTESLVMRAKTGTIRKIEATHRWPKLMRYSAIRFDE